MNIRRCLSSTILGMSSLLLSGQHPDFQKNLEAAWGKPVTKSFSEPLQREVPIGSWTLSAAVDPDSANGFEPVFFFLEGSYRNRGGSFIYREVILSLPQQAALLKTAHPDWSDEEISKHMIFAQLQFKGQDKLPEEGTTFIKALQATQGPILPFTPGQIYLHPTTYSVRSHSGGSQPIEYSTIGWRGTPGELEAELQRGIKEEPLVVLLNRLRRSYLSRWKEGIRRDDYSALLDRLDMEALGGAMFEWACGEGELPLAEKLLAKGLPTDKPSPDGSLPIIAACGTGNRLFIQKLLDTGAKLDVTDAQGRNSLTTACGTGNADLVEWLIQLGATPQFPEHYDSWNPVLVAVNQRSLRLVQTVFKAAGPIPDRVKVGEEVDLLVPVVDPKVATWLLNQGCKPTAAALESVSRRGEVEVMKVLLAAGVDPNTQSPFGNPLMASVEGGNLQAVELLLSRGADPRKVVTQRNPATALELANQIGNQAVVKALEKSASLR